MTFRVYPFQIGDKVRLRSGSPELLVVDVRELASSREVCVASAEMCEAWLPELTLLLIQGVGPRKFTLRGNW